MSKSNFYHTVLPNFPVCKQFTTSANEDIDLAILVASFKTGPLAWVFWCLSLNEWQAERILKNTKNHSKALMNLCL